MKRICFTQKEYELIRDALMDYSDKLFFAETETDKENNENLKKSEQCTKLIREKINFKIK